MEKYVLFSPIGTSDPIRGNYDGPFLHILRHYRPAKAYFLLTQEMCRYHDKDNRYEILGKRICPECKFIPIKCPDFDEPHNYLVSQKIINDVLNKVLEENPDDQIIINITSSTSQITSAIYIYAAMSRRRLTLIQVRTPEGASNKSKPVREDFDIEYEWKNNLNNTTDDDPSLENRCQVITPDNVRYHVASEIIKSHIGNYDYYAALSVTKSYSDLFSKELISLLEAAKHRIALEFGDAEKCARNSGYTIATIRTVGYREIFEYLLYLQCKMKRGDLSEFTRGISPILTDLFTLYLKQIHKFDVVSSLCDWDSKRKYHWIRREKIEKYSDSQLLIIYDRYYKQPFTDKPLAFSNILPAVDYCCGKDMAAFGSDLGRAEELRGFEEKVRNMAAHQITAITDDILQEDYGITADRIFNHLKEIFNKIYISSTRDRNIPWDSYDQMNEHISKLL